MTARQNNVVLIEADSLNGKTESQLDVDKVDGNEASDLGGISGETGDERIEHGKDVSTAGGSYNDWSHSYDTAFNNTPALMGLASQTTNSGAEGYSDITISTTSISGRSETEGSNDYSTSSDYIIYYSVIGS